MSPLDSTPEASRLLASIHARLASLSPPPGVESAGRELSRLGSALANLERRLVEGPDAPLRVAFFGPTGAGKSKLFNSLLGSNVSPAGFRRPFTMKPVYSLHESREALAARVAGDVRLRRGNRWHEVLLIDTPDFDSVESRNREEADRIFAEAEALVFVTDVQKYADQSTWEYLERIFREQKRAVIVLNKVVSEGAELDFLRRLDARFPNADVIPVREHAIDDAALLPPDEPAVEELARHVSSLAGGPQERRAALAVAFQRDLDAALEAWDSASGALRSYQAGLDALRARLEERFRASVAELGFHAVAPVDDGIKREVYDRLLERIQEIDILRYPRKLLALPYVGLKLMAGKWWPFGGKRSGASPEERARNESLQALEAQILRFADASREDFRSERRCPGLVDREVELGLRLPHEELSASHMRVDRAYREWLEREARETASQLTRENKVKFILSQIIYNAALVGAQIHTAGHFTLLEAATDGVLSPLLAKGVGMAVSSTRVGEFERAARAEHQRALAEVLAEARARFDRLLEARSSWVPEFERLSCEMAALREQRRDLLRAFERGDGTAAPRRVEDASR